MSWATFLKEAGELLDASEGDCETPYHYLNIFEDSYFSEDSENETKKGYFAENNLIPWIEKAKKKFEPFKQVRVKIKVRS